MTQTHTTHTQHDSRSFHFVRCFLFLSKTLDDLFFSTTTGQFKEEEESKYPKKATNMKTKNEEIKKEKFD